MLEKSIKATTHKKPFEVSAEKKKKLPLVELHCCLNICHTTLKLCSGLSSYGPKQPAEKTRSFLAFQQFGQTGFHVVLSLEYFVEKRLTYLSCLPVP